MNIIPNQSQQKRTDLIPWWILQATHKGAALERGRVQYLQLSCGSTGCLQIQPNQFPGNFQDIYMIHFFKFPEDFLRDKPYNIKMLSPEITVILFTRKLPHVQCTKNRLTCESYIANYIIFKEHRLNSRRFPVFPGAISNSRRSRSCSHPDIQKNRHIHDGRGLHP